MKVKSNLELIAPQADSEAARLLDIKENTIVLTQSEFDTFEDPTDSGLYPSLIGKNVIIKDAELETTTTYHIVEDGSKQPFFVTKYESGEDYNALQNLPITNLSGNIMLEELETGVYKIEGEWQATDSESLTPATPDQLFFVNNNEASTTTMAIVSAMSLQKIIVNELGEVSYDDVAMSSDIVIGERSVVSPNQPSGQKENDTWLKKL